MSLTGKRALVTGASKGIGAGIALALAREGADVAVNYHSDAAGAEAVVADIRTSGRNAIAIGADVSQVAECQRLVKEAADALGGLDILVNNAGITLWQDFFATDEAHWDATIDTNLKWTASHESARIPSIERGEISCRLFAGMMQLTEPRQRIMANQLRFESRILCQP